MTRVINPGDDMQVPIELIPAEHHSEHFTLSAFFVCFFVVCERAANIVSSDSNQLAKVCMVAIALRC